MSFELPLNQANRSDAGTIDPLPDQSAGSSPDCESTERIRRKSKPRVQVVRTTQRRRKHRKHPSKPSYTSLIIIGGAIAGVGLIALSGILEKTQAKEIRQQDFKPTAGNQNGQQSNEAASGTRVRHPTSGQVR